MALIVKVYINQRCIIDTHAVRIKGKPGQLCTYESDRGEVFQHHYDDGAEELARKLLRQHQDWRIQNEYDAVSKS